MRLELMVMTIGMITIWSNMQMKNTECDEVVQTCLSLVNEVIEMITLEHYEFTPLGAVEEVETKILEHFDIDG